MSKFDWRTLRADDLPEVEAIAAQVHPDFPEDGAVFAERLRLAPDGVHLLEIAGAPAGYFITHPWRYGKLPALNALLGAIPPDADTWYLHDLALLPAARGTGAAGAIVASVLAHARQKGFAIASLVAVNGSVPFWQRQGFIVNEDPALREKLATYEDAARFMVHRLG